MRFHSNWAWRLLTIFVIRNLQFGTSNFYILFIYIFFIGSRFIKDSWNTLLYRYIIGITPHTDFDNYKNALHYWSYENQVTVDSTKTLPVRKNRRLKFCLHFNFIVNILVHNVEDFSKLDYPLQNIPFLFLWATGVTCRTWLRLDNKKSVFSYADISDFVLALAKRIWNIFDATYFDRLLSICNVMIGSDPVSESKLDSPVYLITNLVFTPASIADGDVRIPVCTGRESSSFLRFALPCWPIFGRTYAKNPQGNSSYGQDFVRDGGSHPWRGYRSLVALPPVVEISLSPRYISFRRTALSTLISTAYFNKGAR